MILAALSFSLAAALAAPPPGGGLLAAHPDTAAEWWYYTGHLRTAGGAEFGFELTFFRARLPDGDDLDAAHFALTDVGAKSFRYAEKLHRPFPGIAETDPSRLRVSIENWEAREENGAHVLRASMAGAGISLRLAPQKPAVLNGEGGVSRKGPRPDEYSRYVSIPRLAASGTLDIGGRTESVSGIAWFDHEFGPGGLPVDLAGWDWFSVQLSDGTELMLYRLRTKAGGESPYSQGSFIGKDGVAVPLRAGDFDVAAAGRWRSPKSGAIYPAGWRLRVPSRRIDLSLAPRVADQELVTNRSTRVTYWEGACAVSGLADGRPVTGESYAELTGYAGNDLP
jgi:predicted secreted hydrolase